MQVVAVVVTDFSTKILRSLAFCFFAVSSLLLAQGAYAAVLPEDRADILYHSFDGGGVTIHGPSILMRKQFKEKVSVWGNYYADYVTSASIDVVTSGASEYTEERIEQTVGIDYLQEKSIISVFYSTSVENDYDAETKGIAVSQDFFGDLTTISLSYVQGDDIVGNNTDPTFERFANRKRYSLGLSQILTKNWVIGLSAESVIDEGFLQNPYRSVRFLLPGGGAAARQNEDYPDTRNSDAYAIRSMYYLPWRAALRFEYRTYLDSWGIEADNAEIRYIQPWGQDWVLEAKYRYYTQDQAFFYSDLYPYQDYQTFLGRDKELSTFQDSAVSLGVSYNVNSHYLSAFEKVSVNLFVDYMQFSYDNFREATPANTAEFGVGNEPFYQYDANVIRFFVSFWY